jgi:hypothetical protein
MVSNRNTKKNHQDLISIERVCGVRSVVLALIDESS